MIVIVEWTNFDYNPFVKEFPSREAAYTYMQGECAEIVSKLKNEVAYSRVEEDSAEVTMVNDDMYFWNITEVQ